MRQRLLIIANPCSGKGKVRNSIGKIVKLFSKYDYIINLAFTKAHGDAENLVKTLGKDADIIVCIGGDGTVNEVVNGMIKLGEKKPIGYIPKGTTNDFAKSMGISKNINKCVKTIVNGHTKKIDVCFFNDKYFVYVASFGVFAKSSSTDQQWLKNRFGYLAYVFLGVKEIRNTPQISVELECENEKISGNYIWGAVCNSKSVGGLIKLKDEKIQMNDGKFEILMIKQPKGLKQLISVSRDLKKQNWNNPCFVFKSVSAAKFTKIATDYWSLDGERKIVEDTFVNVGIVKDAIEILG